MATVFFSYSHRDEAVRNEIEVHFAMLKRDGVIETWHDRRITAGEEWAGVIDRNLEDADIILLLVSPYFLDSKYCYDKEMTRALERHDADEACVIPIIVDPCDWPTAPFGKLQAATKDARPISKFPNVHDAYVEITQAVRAAVAKLGKGKGSRKRPVTVEKEASAPASPVIRSSNLRVKKPFTDHDRDSFLESTFEYIAKLFEGSLKELQERNEGISTNFRRINANHFTARIYHNGTLASQCGIRLGGMFRGKQILFSTDPDSTNSSNDSLDVADDGYDLFLKSMMSAFGGDKAKSQLSQQGAAELFWSKLIEPLQR